MSSTAGAIAFYEKAGATEIFRLTEPSGRIGHAEVKLGEMILILSDEFPECGIQGPLTLGGTTFAMHLPLDDVDAAHARAIAAGRRSEQQRMSFMASGRQRCSTRLAMNGCLAMKSKR